MRRGLAIGVAVVLALLVVGLYRSEPLVPTERVTPRTPVVLTCVFVRGNAWSALPGLEYTGRLAVVLPGFSGGELVLIVGDTLPLDVEVEADDGGYVRTRVERLQSGPGPAAPPPDYWLEEGTPWDAPPAVQRVVIAAAADGERWVSVRLGRRAPRVLARLRGYPEWTHARVCAASAGVDEAFQNDRALVVLPSARGYFGTGWSGLEREPDVGEVRWIAHHAAVLVPSARRGAVHVSLRARRGSQGPSGDAAITLRVNDVVTLDERPLREGLVSYEWEIPASAWLAGVNELLFSVSGETPRLNFAVSRLELKMN